MNISTHAAPADRSALPLPRGLLADDEVPAGCGWFESSHELRQGVRVTEHAGFDALPPGVVPLAWQLGCL